MLKPSFGWRLYIPWVESQRAVLKALQLTFKFNLIHDIHDISADNIRNANELYDVLEGVAAKLREMGRKNEDGEEEKNDDAHASKKMRFE